MKISNPKKVFYATHTHSSNYANELNKVRIHLKGTQSPPHPSLQHSTAGTCSLISLVISEGNILTHRDLKNKPEKKIPELWQEARMTCASNWKFLCVERNMWTFYVSLDQTESYTNTLRHHLPHRLESKLRIKKLLSALWNIYFLILRMG